MTTTYDHVIVGGGTTGCVLAARLSKDPSVNVLMIEAGPDYKTPEETPQDLRNAFAVSVDKHDWHYKAETYQGRMIDYARAKCTGGCSAVNGSIALRGLPADYNEWAEWGNTEWHFDKLLPYFKRVEDDPIDAPFHGKGGPLPIVRMKKEDCFHIQQAFVDACMANGEPFAADHNDPAATGVGPLPMNRRGDLRISTAIAYLTPDVRRRKNLTIMPDTLAVRLLFEGKRAVGVEIRKGRGAETIKGGTIHLTAGTVHNPPILWRSGVGPAAELQKLGVRPVLDLPGVGQNLIEHTLSLVALLPKPGVTDPKSPDVQMAVHYTAPGGPSGDMQIYCINKLGRERFPALPPGTADLLYATMVVLNRPNSRGHISITTTDPDAAPKIELNLNKDADDLRRIADGVRKCWKIAHTGEFWEKATGVAVLTQEIIDDDQKLKQYVRDTCATIWHPVGTCKMGPASDKAAVVDQKLKVHGAEGLRIADASIMPNHVSRNPLLTCVVIGEKLADDIQAGH